MTGWIVFGVVVVALGVLAIGEGLRPHSFSRRRGGPWYFDRPSRKP